MPDDVRLRLVESIQNNTKRYIDVFSDAVDSIMPKETKEISYVISANSPQRLSNREQVQG
jgi:hypothetical protein